MDIGFLALCYSQRAKSQQEAPYKSFCVLFTLVAALSSFLAFFLSLLFFVGNFDALVLYLIYLYNFMKNAIYLFLFSLPSLTHSLWEKPLMLFYRCTMHTYKYHTIIRAAFVCLFVPYLLRGPFDGSSPNLVGVCRWTSELPLRGSFSKRSTGRRVTFTFHYIIYAPASRHTAAKGAFCFAATASKSLIRAKGTFCCTASRQVVGVCRWTSEIALEGFFFEKVNGSTGQQVNGSLFRTLYYI